MEICYKRIQQQQQAVQGIDADRDKEEILLEPAVIFMFSNFKKIIPVLTAKLKNKKRRIKVVEQPEN